MTPSRLLLKDEDRAGPLFTSESKDMASIHQFATGVEKNPKDLSGVVFQRFENLIHFLAHR